MGEHQPKLNASIELCEEYSHYVNNWPMTREIRNSRPLNSVLLDLRAGGMMRCDPWLELLGFCPSLDQFNGIQWKWLQSFAPSTSPGGGWRRIPSLFGMLIVRQWRFPPITYRVARNVCRSYFCGLAIFCILRELIFTISTDWFFLLGNSFCDFQKVH